uniref:Uncharacterized protein n=1 Tax=Solanum lycopersicum TaxID=4081 RepID=A0A494G8J4_SOLLC
DVGRCITSLHLDFMHERTTSSVA